jgi:acyl-CoA synthetase (AMP-forming)/AMP-acid ligase II
VPTILAMLLETPAPARSSSTLRFLRTASAPLPALQLQRFEQKFGVPVIETYGLTEAASQVCANPLPPRRHVPGSVGRPVGFSLRICRPRAASWRDSCPLEDVPAGETGEVCPRLANEHQFQCTFVLFPVRTLYHGTGTHDFVGKVHTGSMAHRVLACGRGGMHPQP